MYALLSAQTATAPGTGSGTAEDPYQIASLEELYWLAASDQVVPHPSRQERSSAHYIQTADIQASRTRTWFSGKGWQPIYNFTGSYDGRGHIIDSLYIHDSTRIHVGLFRNTYGAEIMDLGLTNADITGNQYVGALVGLACGYHNSQTYTMITQCYAEGSVTGTWDTGGLVGFNDEGFLENCFSRVSVHSRYGPVGGLVGNNHREVIHCYSSGHVSISDAALVHGLIGNMSGFVHSSFWDTETSGQPHNPDWQEEAYGIDSEEMKRASTFINAGWDFNTIWKIRSSLNESYPSISGMRMPGSHLLRFNVCVSDDFSFDPATDTLRVTGSFFDWSEPGSCLEQELLYIPEQHIWSNEIFLDSGSYEYKYFFNRGWNNPEWTGETLRQLEVSKDTVIPDTLGVLNGMRVSVKAQKPGIFQLRAAYPNPFNPRTGLPLELNEPADVSIKLYNSRGRLVRHLFEGHMPTGVHHLQIDGSNLSSGIYIVQARMNEVLQVQKIALMK
jgi:hypothetical protein